MIRRPPFNSLAAALNRFATLTPDASFPAHGTGRDGSWPKKQRKNLAVRPASASRAPGATLIAASILSAALLARPIARIMAWRSDVRHCAAVGRVHSAHGCGKSKTGAASWPIPAKALPSRKAARLGRRGAPIFLLRQDLADHRDTQRTSCSASRASARIHRCLIAGGAPPKRVSYQCRPTIRPPTSDRTSAPVAPTLRTMNSTVAHSPSRTSTGNAASPHGLMMWSKVR